MAGIVDPGCICARVGGDEFAIVRPNVVSLEEPVHLARLITSTVVDPFDIEWARMVLGVGVGIAIAPGTEPLRRSSFGAPTLRFTERKPKAAHLSVPSSWEWIRSWSASTRTGRAGAGHRQNHYDITGTVGGAAPWFWAVERHQRKRRAEPQLGANAIAWRS